MAKQLELPDGRKLDYAVTEATGRLPLVWCHGSPGCYIPTPALVPACQEMDVPLITFSRPGYGDSTRRKGRSIVDDVDDVKALLNHLGYEQCVVGGWSGGGPHALACAARLPGCLAAMVVASVAPYDAKGLDWFAGQGQDNVEEAQAALKGEEAIQAHYKPQREEMLKTTAASFMESMASLFPPTDKQCILDHDELGKFLEDGFAEALKNNSDGAVDDSLAFCEPWGFDLSEIKCPVALYHGTEDKMCPYGHGQWIAENIPSKYLTRHLEEGLGHISIFIGNEKQGLEELFQLSNNA